jgi:hypothetical protein
VQLVLPSETVVNETTTPEYRNYLLYLLGPRYNYYLMGLAALGLAVGLRRAYLRPLAVWAVLLALLSQPWGLRLGPFRPDLFIIVLFFPASIFLAELIVSVSQGIGRLSSMRVERGSLVLIAVGVLAWGFWNTRSVINASTVFVYEGDVSALEWVKHNTPADARFFINTVGWQSALYRGVDGGFWLLPYSGRDSLVPTMAYGWGSHENILAVSDLAGRAANLKDCSADFWKLVRDADLTHVYVRKGSGALQPEVLSSCTGLEEIYSAEDVFIYKILFP